MLPDTKQVPVFAVPSEPEAPAVAFFELVNEPGTATLHVTVRAYAGEGVNEFFDRTCAFIHWIDQDASLKFKFKDAPRFSGFGKGKGSGGSGVVIKDNKFFVTSVTRIEKAKKPKEGQTIDPAKPNWSYLRVFGEQDGQEVSVDCFVGDVGWRPTDKPVVVKIGTMFAHFMEWQLEVKKDASAMNLTALVAMNEKFHNYELVDLISAI